MKKINILKIAALITIAWMFFMVFLMVKSCENYNTSPIIDNQIRLTKEQTYELFEDAYNSGYRKGRHYARINKLTPFEIDIEADSALIMDKYFK
jgi:hypothetical protein